MSLPTHMSFLMPIDLEHTHVRQIYAQYTHTCAPKYILVTYMYMSTFHTPYRSLFSFFYRSRSPCKCTGLFSKSIDHSKRWVCAHSFAPPFHVLLGIFSPLKKKPYSNISKMCIYESNRCVDFKMWHFVENTQWVRKLLPDGQTSGTHCDALQHTCSTFATHCNILQHTATHYNTLQHTATHCNAL